MRSDPANLIRWEIWDEFSGHVLLPLMPITILLIGGTWLMMRRVLVPVAEAATWARSIRPGRPLPPFPDQGRSTEIEDLMDAVRRSLDRLNSELDAEQRRAGEAAHALRTPVAVLVARLDELGRGPEADRLRADVLALSRTVTQFLSSAGADRLELDEEDRADLSEVAEGVVADLAPFALRRGTEIEMVGTEAPCLVHGSKNAISLALTNLVENAIYHGGSALVSVTVGPGPNEPFVLENVSFTIAPGDAVAITGPSGCGKTTLLKLLCGLLEPTSGQILVDGVPLARIGPEAWRAWIGVVMQDDALFAGSIADNIAFFAADADPDEIEDSARRAAVHDDIEAMPMGYGTLIGDMGTSLSGGQKQRVLLARALYRRPGLLLLDEATSHLDVAREQTVNETLASLAITRIVVAHRPETIRASARVLRLDRGGIVSDGPPGPQADSPGALSRFPSNEALRAAKG